jgi:hypothetical protein
VVLALLLEDETGVDEAWRLDDEEVAPDELLDAEDDDESVVFEDVATVEGVAVALTSLLECPE